ncbi:methyl-accepting chemotaxis protein [Desulfobacterales bacterium HSG2]|nr:methyl-accepting chemotaxis protein [Desulfobacterales bacterium HSG2]
MKWKLLIIFLVLALLPLATVFWRVDTIIESGFEHEYQRNGERIARFVKDTILIFARDSQQNITLLQQNDSLLTAAYFASMTDVTGEIRNLLNAVIQKLSYDTIEIRSLNNAVLAEARLLEETNTVKPDEQAFQKALQGEQVFDMVLQETNLMLRVVVPLHYQQERIGVLTAGIFINDLFVQRLADITHEDIAIFAEQSPIASSDQTFTEVVQPLLPKKEGESAKSIHAVGKIIVADIERTIYTVPLTNDQEHILGLIVIGLARTELNAIQTRAKSEILTFTTILVICSVLIALLSTRSLTRPLGADPTVVANLMRQVANGDLTVTFATDGKTAEGLLAAMMNMVKKLRKIVADLKSGADTLNLSSSNLSGLSARMKDSAEDMNLQATNAASVSVQISGNAGTVASTAEQLNLSVTDIRKMTENMVSAFSDITDSAQKTAQNTATVAESSQNMSAAVNIVASAAEEMTASLNETAKHTSQASRMSQNARRRAEEINRKMDALARASKQIGKIVGIIKNIADQTNMLALNATIEAAGAGEAGKGFAVVAGEVKELAKQSAEATDEISDQVEQIQESTREAVQAIGDMGQVINEIAAISETIVSSVEEQTTTASEISKTVANSAMEIKSVAESADESSNLVDSIVNSTEESSGTAAEIAKYVDGLANDVKGVAASSGEAAKGVHDISDNIQEISSASEKTSESANEVSALSKQLDEIAATLSEIASRFKI